MAIQVGEYKHVGRIGDTSFYKSGEYYLARQAGGPSRAQIKKGKNFERARENYQEFGACSRAGKLLRAGVSTCLKVCDNDAYRRLTTLMTKIKELDLISARGQRQVGKALQTEAARQLLKGFNFNAKAPLEKVLLRKARIGPDGEIFINNLLPQSDIVFPEGATMVEIRGAKLEIDFEGGCAEICPHTEVQIKKGSARQNLVLRPKKEMAPKQNVLYFLQLMFYTPEEEMKLPKTKGGFHAMAIIEVDPVITETKKEVVMREEEVSLESVELCLPEGILLPEKEEEVFCEEPGDFAPG